MDASDVGGAQQKTSLTRTMRVADELSVDNGRIVIRLVDVKGRRAVFTYMLDPAIRVDKPPKPKG